MGASSGSTPGLTDSEFQDRVPQVSTAGRDLVEGWKLKTEAPGLTEPLWANHFDLPKPQVLLLQNRDNSKTYICGFCYENQVVG